MKRIDPYASLEERRFYADLRMPEMKSSYAIIPLLLTIPLFSITRKPAKHIDETYHRKGLGYVRYTGPQLTQSHLSVLLGLARMAGGHIVDAPVKLRPSTFLSSIGWSDKHENKLRLIEILDDLKAGQLRIWTDGTIGGEQYALRTSLVHKFEPSADRTLPWFVMLDETVLELFADGVPRTLVSISQRAQLNVGLGTWLHGYIMANSCTFPISYRDVYEACGSTAGDLQRFCEDVRAQLKGLKALGIIRDWRPAKERGKFCVFK